MNVKFRNLILIFILLGLFAFSQAQTLERPNLIWARTTSETITLDGKLDEASWAKAESFRIKYGEMSKYIPGSGWVMERGVEPSDPTDATIRFLVNGNKLYMAADVKDKSVGGGLFNQFDGFLMNIRDHSGANYPAGPFEYFYGWVTETWADTTLGEVGALPGFFGWAGGDRDVWDAVTVVHGVSNDDSQDDEGYTVEFMFDLSYRGYDVTRSGGDIIEFNMSIYDADWQWPMDADRFSGNRTWWQGPWGNASAYDVIRIYARPDVTTESGAVPEVGPEWIVQNGANHADPVIDGKLDDAVWANVQGFDIRYGDDDLRASYPGVGPWRSGQFQPEIDGVRAAVLDPGDATVKMFFKDNMLYLGVDVRDQAVWGINNPDMWDGIRFVINDRMEMNPIEHNLERRSMEVYIDTLGQMKVGGYLEMLIDSLQGAQAALALKPNTTVNDYNDVDEGFSIELAIDLTRLGYPVGRGDGVLFISATLFDGEKFANSADNYGTRTWWFRENTWPAAPCWAYMDPGSYVPNGHETQALERPNLIWARTTSESITLDGKLDEASWANAESFRFQYGKNSSFIPGSGWVQERGVLPSDPTDATVKFLVNENNLYMAVTVQDSSVGGGLFNQFDGFLMNLRDHSGVDRPAGPFEYFYGWVAEPWADTTTAEVGADPGFFGWAGGDRDVWDAVTLVNGVTNDDSSPDAGYTTEFKFNLTPRGYDVSKADGDIIEFNMSVYDADWQWPMNPDKFSGNRTWWQGPWGNASAYDVIRIYARPDVTVNSGPVPIVGPEAVVQNGVNHPEPVIDGKLDEDVWSKIDGFDIRYGDDELRNSYAGIGPWRSGQFQPEIDGVKAAVLDPGDATIKMFFKDNMLYLGVDVRDQAVWGINNPDMWDGIRFVINDRSLTNPVEHNLERREVTAYIDTLGQLALGGYLQMLVDSLGGAQVAMQLKPNTTVNDYNDVDEGFTIEMALDLTEFGYPVGLGDGVLFISATLFDGEKFANAADNYGTRTWWFRENTWPAAPAWAVMDPAAIIPLETAIEDQAKDGLPTKFELLGNYPNPFNPGTRIRYALPKDGNVRLTVYNVLGQKVALIPLGMQRAGFREAWFNAGNLSSGLYFYYLEVKSAGSHNITKPGRMLLLK